MQKNILIRLLDSYLEKWLYFEEEKDDILKIKEFVNKNLNFMFRDNLDWHITNSAWIISHDYKKALLIHHKKLDKWFQVWWHCEKEDLNLQNWAFREAIEETWIKNLELFSDDIFDIDIHEIPEKWEIKKHLHYDIRFLFKTDELNLNNFNKEEVKDIKWVLIDDLISETKSNSIKRMALKTLKK